MSDCEADPETVLRDAAIETRQILREYFKGDIPSPTAVAIAAGRSKMLTVDDDSLTSLGSEQGGIAA